MKDSTLTRLTVAELLERWPQAIPVFLGHRMACVGCAMARFETLVDAAAVYNIPSAQLVNELRQTIHPPEENL